MTPSTLPSTLLRRTGTACVRQGWRSWLALHHRDDRGDVPGWVMITVMTAGLVAMLSAVAGDQLQSMLQSALSSVAN